MSNTPTDISPLIMSPSTSFALSDAPQHTGEKNSINNSGSNNKEEDDDDGECVEHDLEAFMVQAVEKNENEPLEDVLLHHQHHHHQQQQQQQQQQPQQLVQTTPSSSTSSPTASAAETETTAPSSIFASVLDSFQYVYSTALLLFCVVLVMATMITKQTVATAGNDNTEDDDDNNNNNNKEWNLTPAAAVVLFWLLLAWLALMEGGQGCLVGLQLVDPTLYATTHPKTLKMMQIVHAGGNLERFIVGRQFLVVVVVFAINMMAGSADTTTTSTTPTVLGLPNVVHNIFIESGLAMILVTVIIGQIAAQINAACSMLDFLNNYVMLFTTYISLAIEASGLLHVVYLVQYIFAAMAKKKSLQESDDGSNDNEQPRSRFRQVWFGLRIVFSISVLGFAFAVTLSALLNKQTTMWDDAPTVLSVVLFFVLMCFIGLLENMQIALFAILNLPAEELKQHTTAHRNCQLVFGGAGSSNNSISHNNLQAFLIGRQICVTVCMFVLARITTQDVDTKTDEDTVFGVPKKMQEFFNTGLLGAVITTIVASLAWRVVAASFPLAFLSNPLIRWIIRLCLLLEESGVCSAAWVLARYHKILAKYQPDDVYLKGAEPHTAEPVTQRDNDIDRVVTIVKFFYSLALLIFSVVLIMGAIFSEQTTGTSNMGIPAVVAFFIFWFLICWLAMMEGGQGALVGLQPIDKSRYAETHPRSFWCASLAHKGDNMERFIVGRQFLVILVVFVINMMGSAVADASVLGISNVVNEIFLSTGIAVSLVTIILGQLTGQINAANCMLDFINNFFMLFTTYVALAIEMSGLLHSVYLVQIIFSKITGKPIEFDERPRSAIQNVWFWTRVIISFAILGLAFAVTLSALFNGQTAMWDGVPEVVSVIVFFVLMCFVGVMEGMQIAFFAVANMPEEELEKHSVARTNCEVAFRDQNLQAFLIGRQICVTICMFIVARVTTIDVDLDAGEDTVFGVSDGVQEFFNTGLLGAVITTIVGSLAWRIIASSFPAVFLNNYLIYLIIRLCLLLEASGICSAAWVLARFNKLLAGYQPDDVYLKGEDRHTKAPVTRRDMDIDITVTVLKYAYSMGLLVFSVIIVMSAIFSEQTKVAQSVNPIFACIVIWLMLFWLAIMEGGQGCLVGLRPVNKDLYATSHPRSLRTTKIVHKGDNMERFIVGRQFLVVLVVFVINMCGAAVANASVLGLSGVMTEVFLTSGIALILMTIMLGQLCAQVNAANCMLDFINSYFMLFTTYVALVIEASGLLHSVYLVQAIFSRISGKPIVSEEPPRNRIQNAFFWFRVLLSITILAFSFAVTLSALFSGQTTMYEGVPEAVSVVLLFILMCFVGIMEGMQIALFAILNLPEEETKAAPLAAKTRELAFSGSNLQAFLIGRQICVTICMFIVARITSCDVDVNAGEDTIFGVPGGVQEFFNTGLLGAVITTIVASLAWRIIASSFPVAFLNNYLVHLIIRLCLVFEASGVCSASWLLALIHRHVIGYKPDEAYFSNTEKRSELRKSEEEDFDVTISNETV